MGHDLFQDTMAWVKTPPWHQLGVEVPASVTAVEMVKAANLDWKVDKRAALGASTVANGKVRRYELVRVARHDREKSALLGLVSSRYTILQNTDAFRFFDPFIQEGFATYETAGALGDGERVWVLVKLDHDIEVAPGDVVQRYLLLSNRHDGRGSVRVKFTPIRVVCQNTLNAALDDGAGEYTVRHLRSMNERLAKVRHDELRAVIDKMFGRLEELYARLLHKPMSEVLLERYLMALYPLTQKQRDEGLVPERWKLVRDAFENDERNPRAVRGTLWCAYNAVVFFEDFRVARGANADSRLARVWFGSGADLKMRALKIAQDLLAVA